MNPQFQNQPQNSVVCSKAVSKWKVINPSLFIGLVQSYHLADRKGLIQDLPVSKLLNKNLNSFSLVLIRYSSQHTHAGFSESFCKFS